MNTNPDVLLSRKLKQVRNRVKEIQDAWDRRYGDKEEDYADEDEYY